jgi:flagellar L-ring protein precursor FlgH
MAVFMAFANVGCAGLGSRLRSLVTDSPSENKKPVPPQMSFAQNSNLPPGPQRQYKRTTRSSFEDQSRVDARAGSLWVMEGQGAYLFSENIIRLVGDPLTIQLDGEPKQQLETKVNVIRNLLARIDGPRRSVASNATKTPVPPARGAKPNDGAAAGDAGAEGSGADDPGANAAGASPSSDGFDVKNIPTRVVERLVDGNYRVRGSQTFMIGRREYRVLLTGIVRAEEFSEEGVQASRLLEPRFDIVAAPKGAQKL